MSAGVFEWPVESDPSWPVVIAWSGKGLLRNRDNTTQELIPELYHRTLPSQPASGG